MWWTQRSGTRATGEFVTDHDVQKKNESKLPIATSKETPTQASWKPSTVFADSDGRW